MHGSVCERMGTCRCQLVRWRCYPCCWTLRRSFFLPRTCRHPSLHRPYRIPLPTWGCIAMLLPACLLLMVLLIVPWATVRPQRALQLDLQQRAGRRADMCQGLRCTRLAALHVTHAASAASGSAAAAGACKALK